MSSGTINESPIFVRELVKEALMYDANSAIVSHNHPGGAMNPSRADIDATRAIKYDFSNQNKTYSDFTYLS